MGWLCKIFGHNWHRILSLRNENEIWRCACCGLAEEYQIGDLLRRHIGEQVVEVGPNYHRISAARWYRYGKDIWWVAPSCNLNVQYKVI